ncbi:hypothetical protein N9D23_13245 [Rubripirellula sp.]|jgi:hypothetical protein|nr:hypothetical protein [Rubripirellula sp.]MDF1842914.1 hypothetical protein [Rubripirellula sp.]
MATTRKVQSIGNSASTLFASVDKTKQVYEVPDQRSLDLPRQAMAAIVRQWLRFDGSSGTASGVSTNSMLSKQRA